MSASLQNLHSHSVMGLFVVLYLVIHIYIYTFIFISVYYNSLYIYIYIRITSFSSGGKSRQNRRRLSQWQLSRLGYDWDLEMSRQVSVAGRMQLVKAASQTEANYCHTTHRRGARNIDGQTCTHPSQSC